MAWNPRLATARNNEAATSGASPQARFQAEPPVEGPVVSAAGSPSPPP